MWRLYSRFSFNSFKYLPIVIKLLSSRIRNLNLASVMLELSNHYIFIWLKTFSIFKLLSTNVFIFPYCLFISQLTFFFKELTHKGRGFMCLIHFCFVIESCALQFLKKIFSVFINLSPAVKPVHTMTHPFHLYNIPPLTHLFFLLYFDSNLTNACLAFFFFLMYFYCYRALTHSRRPSVF